MPNLFFGALTKNGRIFVKSSQRKIGEEIKKNKIAWHNVLIYSCQQKGGDGEIKMKSLSGRKVRFKPNSVQIESLREACQKFVEN